MATVFLRGTQLEETATALPLTKPFLWAIGLTFIVAMHFFMPNPGGAGLHLSFNPPVWIGISIALGVGFYHMADKRQFRFSKLSIILLICTILLTIPTFYTHSTSIESMGRIFGLWAGILLLLVLQQFSFSAKHKQRLLWFILLAALIEASLGYYQYFFITEGNFWGYDTLTNRPYGIFQQPNVMASFLATGLILSGYLLARSSNQNSIKRLPSSFICIFSPIFIIPLIFVLGSRTGWLSAIIGSALLLFHLYKNASLVNTSYWSGGLLLGTLLGFGASLTHSNDFISEKVDLDSPRSYTFPQAVDMFVEKPLSGYGYGNFESEYILYTARQHELDPDYPSGLASMHHPHNEVLLWAVEGGSITLLAIAIAAIAVCYRIYQGKSGTRIGLLALFIPLALHSQLEYPFYHSAIHWITLIILLYWLDQRTTQYKALPFHTITYTLLRVMSLALPILVSLFMVSALHSNAVLSQFERSNPRNIDILEQVTNPLVWQTRYEWNIFNTYLFAGIQTNNADLVQSYIRWSREIIKQTPRPIYYQLLILAYQRTEQEHLAQQVKKEAIYLFPKSNFSQNHIDQLIPLSDKNEAPSLMKELLSDKVK
ncbi:PglL family O-oligosaccharyltransferase [Vibrio sp.]|nr:PglL family O-oligosaccharyltransferase [Vibrio sp.]